MEAPSIDNRRINLRQLLYYGSIRGDEISVKLEVQETPEGIEFVYTPKRLNQLRDPSDYK